MRADSIRYLRDAGFDFKPAESPDLWSFLEAHFIAPHHPGPKFAPMPSSLVAEVIAAGENALLEAMENEHRRTRMLSPVTLSFEMPFIVGTDGTVPLSHVDAARIINLIEHPGTVQEHIVHLLPAMADAIPGTSRVTVRGGLYADGHTAGYFNLHPGNRLEDDAAFALLATHGEITALVHEMQEKIENIVLHTRAECEAMLTKARKSLAV